MDRTFQRGEAGRMGIAVPGEELGCVTFGEG